jgi:hypothetical protein
MLRFLFGRVYIIYAQNLYTFLKYTYKWKHSFIFVVLFCILFWSNVVHRFILILTYILIDWHKILLVKI